ncbi:MAG: hypothetical protein CMH54_01270 [Myxococcales bacterium]|nr:hypothetical protein [Myxococcales bacterium]
MKIGWMVLVSLLFGCSGTTNGSDTSVSPDVLDATDTTASDPGQAANDPGQTNIDLGQTVVDEGAEADTSDVVEHFCPETTEAQVAATGVVVNALGDPSDGDKQTFVCVPPGTGPFPAVLYNHGGLNNVVGGNLEGTCTALANAGYLARAEYRPGSLVLPEHLQQVYDGLDALRGHSLADTSRVGILGFSRGGLLSLHVAIERDSDVQAVVLMAPAPGGGMLSLSSALDEDVAQISAPVRVYVSANDLFQADHIQLATDVYDALMDYDKDVELIEYPAFCSDGHALFFEVREPYWSDVLSFLDETIGN